MGSGLIINTLPSSSFKWDLGCKYAKLQDSHFIEGPICCTGEDMIIDQKGERKNTTIRNVLNYWFKSELDRW